MLDLIENITINTGISADKASEILQTVSEYLKEKYPLLAGTVDSVLNLKNIQQNDSSNDI